MAFELPSLPYAFNALEPHIDALTMEIHHGRHHKAYVDNLNKALEGNNAELEEIVKNISKYSAAVRNNGGGHWNHTFFWEIMGPGASQSSPQPAGDLAQAINSSWGSFAEFQTAFAQAGITRFGSGWAWLVVQDGKLAIGSTPNQDNPLMDISDFKGTPILGVDVWEHAYYLKYQNKRPDYLSAFWNVINWEAVAKRYAAAK